MRESSKCRPVFKSGYQIRKDGAQWENQTLRSKITPKEMTSLRTYLMHIIPDYPLHLVEPYTMTEEQLGEFHTSLKQVLSYIKLSKEKEKTKKLVFEDDAFTHLERDAAWVIEASTNTKLQVQKTKGECVDMCQALIDWEAEARADEREKVKEEVTEKVTNEVTEKVTNEVTEKVTSDVTHAVIKNMYREDFSIEQIARVMEKSVEEIKEILQL